MGDKKRLEWDKTGEHIYETGVKHGVLYPMETSGAKAGTYPNGVVWNGLTAVTESPSGAETTPLWADDIKYLNLISAEEFGATVEAYTYPDEFALCDGSAEIADGVIVGQQSRKTFGMAYSTVLGNDVANDAYGRKIHIIYGAVASPSEKAYNTVNDSPEAVTFSWELKTTPVNVTDAKPTASITINSTKANETCLAKLEAILYGADEFDATKTYAVGDVVSHEDTEGSTTVVNAYICKTAITEASTWDASKWTKIAEAGPRLPLPDEIKSITTVPTVG